MDLEWCRQPDRGLPRPDIVFFLDVSGEEAQKRGGYGEERYERKEFQVSFLFSVSARLSLKGHYKLNMHEYFTNIVYHLAGKSSTKLRQVNRQLLENNSYGQ